MDVGEAACPMKMMWAEAIGFPLGGGGVYWLRLPNPNVAVV